MLLENFQRQSVITIFLVKKKINESPVGEVQINVIYVSNLSITTMKLYRVFQLEVSF